MEKKVKVSVYNTKKNDGVISTLGALSVALPEEITKVSPEDCHADIDIFSEDINQKIFESMIWFFIVLAGLRMIF